MRRRLVPLIVTLAFLFSGLAATWLGTAAVARQLWMAGVVIAGAPLVFRTIRSIAHGRLATDVVASLSIVGAIVLGQPLAGLVIVLMQTGGEALERFAEGRASAAVRALEAAAPRIAHRVQGSAIVDVAVGDVLVGDTLVVRPGDLIPCDGVVLSGESELDTSSLTGEALPVRAAPGVALMSGTLNGFGSFEMRTTAPAVRSRYARIVEMVRAAQASKAPLQRVA
ncbi:MAG TPA: hypothetical protein VN651_05040, partial [Gemmatimonadaceae bacterium]|nr:hypothetical protein [Gemmatimonadaceae bacterium]